MQSEEIRERFLKFFEKRGHAIIPSASLVPENDPSVLFTTAGMQQFKPYYLGKESPYGKNVVSVQKCIRTSDIEEVGDERHLTFFEMLGNFSFSGYWKKEAIGYAHEFITKEIGLEIDYVTVFEGENSVPEDKESEEIWKSIDPDIVVKKFGRADNFWGPTGNEGPCGPTTEIYVNGIEIWNIVFNEYYQSADKTLKPLEIKGVDTGMGLERLAMVSQNVSTVFETDLFKFANYPKTKSERIIADHVRAAIMMVADGVTPSNTERGYVLRRLIRRACMQSKPITETVEAVMNFFHLQNEKIMKVIQEEVKKFAEVLSQGFKEFERGRDPFVLVTSFGLPLEEVKELAKQKGIEINEQEFAEKFKEHQELSRAGAEQKFKGGLAGHSEMEVKYHTATHLLHQALREVLGKEVYQKGSNITPERLRFDFSFPRKMTDEEKNKVTELVNDKIGESLPVSYQDLGLEEAQKLGAIGLFEEKYGDKVRVYKIGDFSLEFCGGPHIENTGALGKFKILKEEAVSAGTRRIKAVLS